MSISSLRMPSRFVAIAIAVTSQLIAGPPAFGGSEVPEETVALVRLVDVTGDGKPDKISLGSDGEVTVAVHTGGQTYEMVQQSLPLVHVSHILPADLNRDGLIDLYLVSSTENVALIGDGVGGFVDATEDLGLSDGGWGVRAEQLDANSDELPDLLLHNHSGDMLFWARPNGSYDLAWKKSASTMSPSAQKLAEFLVSASAAGSNAHDVFVLFSIQTVLDAYDFFYINDGLNEVDTNDILDGSLQGPDVSTSIGDVTHVGGNVGLGTSTPTAQLDVAGEVAINGSLVINTAGEWVGEPTGLQGPPGADGSDGAQGPAGNDGAQGPTGMTGAAGADGSDGAQGPAGNDGAQGPAGMTGAAGADGSDGAQGPTGMTGAAGADGSDGAQGPAGNDGAQGPAGMTGAAGADGSDGAQGPAGNDGAQGPSGMTGAAGADGSDGAQGPAGNDGAQGPMGMIGPAGADGMAGAQGPAGSDGAQGPTGMTGAAGADGSDGAQGPAGNDGAQGPAGMTGAAGADGLDGAQGPTGLTGAAGADGSDGAQGPAGNDGAQGPTGMTGADGSDGAQGPAGNDGAQGPTGMTGAAGADGSDGAQGPAGNDGAQGPAGMTGAAGADGLDGAQGPTGLTGAAGADGSDGAQGPAGNDGAQGPTGMTGAAGADGSDGAQGPTGLTGAAGADGSDGSDGAQGPAGNDGAQGPAGMTGAAGADGSDGAQGPAGNDGAQGPTGMTGAAGADGSDGAQGPAGNDGAQGPTGMTGAAGADGSDGAQGPTGMTGAAGADGLDGAQGPTGMTGAAGADGPDGAQGPAGNDGAQGPTGMTGSAGADGSDGAQGSAGNDGAQGPMGMTGPAGTDGMAGAQGPAGPAGVSFVRTALVAGDGTEAVNGFALLSALSGITATAADPWVLKLEPGLYDLGAAQLVLQPFIDLEGSGETVTHIKGSRNLSGVVLGADDSQVRLLTIEGEGLGTPICFQAANTSPSLSQVTLFSNGSGGARGLQHSGNASVDLDRVTIDIKGPSTVFGIYGTPGSGIAAELRVNDSLVKVTNTGGGLASGILYSGAGRQVITDSRIEAISSSASGVYGVRQFNAAATTEISNSLIQSRLVGLSDNFGGTIRASNCLIDAPTELEQLGGGILSTFDCLDELGQAVGDNRGWSRAGAIVSLTDVGDTVGIGTGAPTFTLEVNGTAGKPGGGSWSNSSDRRLKKNIADMQGVLDRLLQLRGVTYEYIDPQAIRELPGTRLGMIAQEVEEVFPDWVHTADGFKRLTYRGFEALTVEALRELREEKDGEIAELHQQLDALTRRLDSLMLTGNGP